MAKKTTGARIIREPNTVDPIKMDNYISKELMKKVKGEVVKRNGMKKYASGLSVAPGTYYNPLYTPTSLQLPRDRKQINVWTRHFYETEAIPAAVIDLYASLPITDYSIECSNPYYKKYCEDMLDRLNIRELLQGLSLEYWKIGDVFIMGELDEENKDWKRFVILNPDQIEVKTNVLINEPYYEMIPDENLKRLISDQEPRQQFNELKISNPEVIQAVRAGKNVPIDPAHLAHLKHTPTPYGTYGVPLLKRVFKTLMYKEMIRRAQFTIAERYVMPLKIFKLGTMDELPEQHEIDDMQAQLTQLMADPTMVMVTHARFAADWQGIAGKTLQLNGEYDFIEREIISGLGVSRAFLDGLGPCLSFDGEALTNQGFKNYSQIDQENDLLARFNPETKMIEWVKPEGYHAQLYNGFMIRFKTGSVEKLVSRNHKIPVQFNVDGEWGPIVIREAEELYKLSQQKGFKKNKFRLISNINHEGEMIETVKIGNHELDINTYLKLAGYFVSEGSIVRDTFYDTGAIASRGHIRISQIKTSKHWNEINELMESLPKDWKIKYYQHDWLIYSKDLEEHFKQNFYVTKSEEYRSTTKSLPFWLKNIPKEYLTILFNAMLNGDGSRRPSTKKNVNSPKVYNTYITSSSKLASDFQEIAIKLGFTSKVKPRKLQMKKDGSGYNNQTWAISASSGIGKNGEIIGHYPTFDKKSQVSEEPYKGIIWCPDVGGSHLFVSRYNGFVCITQNTYANASIGGNAFLQKLENFRQTLKEMVEKKIFKPIAELNQWYDKDPDTDEDFLVVPEFKWDALRLQDEISRQQTLMALRGMSLISARTMLDSLHINAETEAQNMMEERDTIYDANRIMARQMMIQMAVQAQAQKQMMDMQLAMTPQPPGATPSDPNGVDVAGAGSDSGDMLSGLPGTGGEGGGISGLKPGTGFSPPSKATSKPPVAASLIEKKIDEIKLKIQAILDEPE